MLWDDDDEVHLYGAGLHSMECSLRIYRGVPISECSYIGGPYIRGSLYCWYISFWYKYSSWSVLLIVNVSKIVLIWGFKLMNHAWLKLDY
jgi:hypothetical protein